mgnify:CR=1 FL=1
MKQKREEQVVFGVGPCDDNKTAIILGVSKSSWEYMKDGLCHAFDLSSIGLPLKIVLFGAETREIAQKQIEKSMHDQGVPVLDETRRDFSIKGPADGK